MHYAGESAWVRHPDDEVVMVIDGETTMTLVIDAAPLTYAMAAIQLIVVPANTRHRLHTTNSVQVMTITPQPSERRLDDPSELA